MYSYSICLTARKVFARYRSLACCAALLNLALAPLAAAAETTLPLQPTLGDNASYSLTPVEEKNRNVVTFYSYSLGENGEFSLSPQYYQLNLRQTQYGQSDAENVRFFFWDVYNSEWLFEDIEGYDPEDWTDELVIMYRYHSEGADERLEVTAEEALSEDITRDFVRAGNSSGHGGAINNTKGAINATITGDFIGNLASNQGGAIYNTGAIDSVIGDYVGNHSQSYGGAIYNSGNIASLVGDYLGNYAGVLGSRQVMGGALYNSGNIDSLKGDFIGNYIVNGAGIAEGGALYNYGTITSLTGDFIGNSVTGPTDQEYQVYGGAIYNSAEIGDITGNFIGNSAVGHEYHSGAGAIHNNATSASAATIASITGDFIGNHSTGNGGAIYNGAFTNRTPYKYAEITAITGNFIGNYVSTGTMNQAIGGAIRSHGIIGTLEGDFIGNYAESISQASGGGALANFYMVGSHKGDFIGNHVSSKSERAMGGALYNAGTFTNGIIGSFIGNFAVSETGSAMGGAIYTTQSLTIFADGSIGDGKTVIMGNYIQDKDHQEKYYQAIYFNNTGTLTFNANNGGEIYVDDIIDGTTSGYTVAVSGDERSVVTFNREILNAKTFTLSGSTLNLGVTDGVSTDHTSKVATAAAWYDYESALLNNVKTQVSLNSGATVNIRDARATNYTFTKLTTDSTARASVDIVNDGASYELSIMDGNGDTKTVNASKSDRLTVGKGSTGKITLASLSISGASAGEDIYAQIIHYTGDDAANFRAENDEIIQLSGEDLGSLSTANAEMTSREVLVGGAELLTSNTWHDTIHVTEWKDALEAWAELEVDAGVRKVFTIVSGDTVQLPGTLSGDDITIKGETATGSTLDLVNNQLPDIGREKSLTLANLTLTNATSLTNEGTLTLDTVNPGAALTVTNLGTLVVKGAWQLANTITSATAGQGELHFEDAATTITGTVQNQNITHSGESETHLVVAGNGFGSFAGNALNMQGGDLYLHAEEAAAALQTLSPAGVATVAETTLGSISLGGETLHLRSLTIGDGNIHVGTLRVDMAARTIGRITADSYSYDALNSKGHIYVAGLAIANDGAGAGAFSLQFADEAIAAAVVPFADEPLAEKPADGSAWTSSAHRVWGAVLEWSVTYSYDTGYYNFSATQPEDPATPGKQPGVIEGEEEGGKSGVPDSSPNPGKGDNSSTPRDPGTDTVIPDTDVPDTETPGTNTPGTDAPGADTPGTNDPSTDTPGAGKPSGSLLGVNPSILAGSAAEQGAFASMSQVFNHAFSHVDLFSTYLINAHRSRSGSASTALAANDYFGRPHMFSAYRSSAGTDRNSGMKLAAFKGGMWLSTYSSFEKMPINNAPKTTTDLYGALVLGSTDLHEHSNGWFSTFSAYAAYMGGTQKFSRGGEAGTSAVHTTLNGGAAGVTGTFYKGNFYTALTASYGASAAHSSTMWGSESIQLSMVGVASRSGYSIALGESGFILQPSLQISYTRVDSNDYYNAAGVYMDSDPMHVIRLNPFVKLIRHTASGWDPYLTVGYVHNFMGKTSFKANSYKLPELSVDPYAEYTLGVQKTWSEKYTIYGQATGRNGGRQGVEVSAGLRWAW